MTFYSVDCTILWFCLWVKCRPEDLLSLKPRTWFSEADAHFSAEFITGDIHYSCILSQGSLQFRNRNDSGKPYLRVSLVTFMFIQTKSHRIKNTRMTLRLWVEIHVNFRCFRLSHRKCSSSIRVLHPQNGVYLCRIMSTLGREQWADVGRFSYLTVSTHLGDCRLRTRLAWFKAVGHL